MLRYFLLLIALTAPVDAQWTLQESHSTASLRGVHSLGGGVAWASGSNGTVLRTVDGGKTWETCAVPPSGEKLDFRGVQAFDAKTAIVMSSGKGDLSRLYKTNDGCQSWKLVFTNPDPDGFWDGLQSKDLSPSRIDGKFQISAAIIGDPVAGKFQEFFSTDGDHWVRGSDQTLPTARTGEALFAASNSAFLNTTSNGGIFVTGGPMGARARILSEDVRHEPRISWKVVGGDIPLASGDGAGAFSVATSWVQDHMRTLDGSEKTVRDFPRNAVCIAVGGDYKMPDKTNGTAAFTRDGGDHWNAPHSYPHGYRSAVAYDPSTKAWITVGPNGTDVSTDDGKNWKPLRPLPGDALDADQHWNALSLPFVVGSRGRIGILRGDALAVTKTVEP